MNNANNCVFYFQYSHAVLEFRMSINSVLLIASRKNEQLEVIYFISDCYNFY